MCIYEYQYKTLRQIYQVFSADCCVTSHNASYRYVRGRCLFPVCDQPARWCVQRTSSKNRVCLSAVDHLLLRKKLFHSDSSRNKTRRQEGFVRMGSHEISHLAAESYLGISQAQIRKSQLWEEEIHRLIG